MMLQSVCLSVQNYPPPANFSRFGLHTVKHWGNHAGLLKPTPRIQIELKSIWPSLKTGPIFHAVNLNSSRALGFRVNAITGSEPFRGKSGSVSFRGLSHQSVEENKLVSSPFEGNSGSLLWVLAPIALISSIVAPQFIVGVIEDVFENAIFAEILASISTEIIFYAGLAIFLLVTRHIQKPYLQFSPNRWSLITGFRGHSTSALLTTGFKIFAPLLAVFVTWSVLGLPAILSVAPYLVGFLAQYVFERQLKSNGSSCWPLVPIIFEVYRIHQLMRATGFVERLVYGMKEASVPAGVLDSTTIGAFLFLIMTFRILGGVCIWSLVTFLLRLFPVKPVAENH